MEANYNDIDDEEEDLANLPPSEVIITENGHIYRRKDLEAEAKMRQRVLHMRYETPETLAERKSRSTYTVGKTEQFITSLGIDAGETTKDYLLPAAIGAGSALALATPGVLAGGPMTAFLASSLGSSAVGTAFSSLTPEQAEVAQSYLNGTSQFVNLHRAAEAEALQQERAAEQHETRRKVKEIHEKVNRIDQNTNKPRKKKKD